MDTYEHNDGYGRHDHHDQPLKGFLSLVLCSQFLGIVIVIVTAIWLGTTVPGNSPTGFGWDDERVFRYHPLFMVIGMIFLYADAILVYRVFRNSTKTIIKILHAVLHVAAFIFAVVGLKAVFTSHYNKKLPNLQTLHSWIGLGVIILFTSQWLVGFVSFLFPKLSDKMRQMILPFHRNLGLGLFLAAIAVALMGILEYSINSGAIKKSENDEPKAAGTLGNILGLLILSFGFVVAYTIAKTEYKRVDDMEEERIYLHDN